MLEMLAWLPERSLIVGRRRLRRLRLLAGAPEAGHDFVIRVGGNVTLLKQLGYYREGDGRVYLWPDRPAQRRKPPLSVLRLVVAHDGKRPVYLVTSVLSCSTCRTGGSSISTVPGGASKSSIAASNDPSAATSCARLRRRMCSSNSTGRWRRCGRPVCTPSTSNPLRATTASGRAWPACFAFYVVRFASLAWRSDRCWSRRRSIRITDGKKPAARTPARKPTRPATLHHKSSKPAQHKSASPPN